MRKFLKSKAYIFLLITFVLGCNFIYSHNAESETERGTAATTETTASKGTLLDPSKLQDPLPRNLFVELYKSVNPTVVSIFSSQKIRMQRDPMQDMFEQFFGRPGGSPPPQQERQGLGTGFIIRPDGLIVTNNHVVQGASEIKVQLDSNNEKFYDAEIIGRDQRTDIALIKIKISKPLPVATLGTSKDVQVGEWVAALGNPYGHAHTISKGIISALGREIKELNRFPFIQTDASINPGNSGGPLVNTKGEVIGVNTAIDARAQGIGFAIPIDNVKTVIKQLEENGRVKKGFVGIGIQPVDPNLAAYFNLKKPEGVLITQVFDKSPAQKAGVKEEDLVLEFNGKKVATPDDLTDGIADAKVGSTAKMKVLRIVNDKPTEKNLEIEIKDMPEQMAMGSGGPTQDKKYFGQKAPFDLGFKVSDMTPEIAQELGVAPGSPRKPVIIEIEPGTLSARVGMQPGDIVLSVNRQEVTKAVDVIKALKKKENMLRIQRGGFVMVVTMRGGGGSEE